MAQQAVELLDLPDEMLLMILKNLRNIHIMYSLEGVNKRLDAMAFTVANSRVINLAKQYFNGDSCSTYDIRLNRICSQILPRICHNIKEFCLDTSIMERVLLGYKYPSLSSLVIMDFCPETALNYLTDESSIANLLKEQITMLFLRIRNDTTRELFTKAYIRLLMVCKKLEHLEFKTIGLIYGTKLSLHNFLTSTCFSSTLYKLTVDLSTFDDCLYLLDGRLNQLSTFIVNIDGINASSLDIDNKKILPNLRIFSLICIRYTDVYDTRILPLFRRMSNLEHLTLNIRMKTKFEFIDGIHLENEILSHMSQLEKFDFHITMNVEIIDPQHQQSVDDIEHTFKNWKLGEVKYCVDYFPNNDGKCDIYSIPYKFSDMYNVGNSFRGHSFKYVIRLGVHDERPFEHDFFCWVADAFPNLKNFVICNEIPQERKHSNDRIDDRHHFSKVHYPNLFYLNLRQSHIDYVNQFLYNAYTHISQPIILSTSHEHLMNVTNNFTNDFTRVNCSQVKYLIINKPFVHPESFYCYFPLL